MLLQPFENNLRKYSPIKQQTHQPYKTSIASNVPPVNIKEIKTDENKYMLEILNRINYRDSNINIPSDKLKEINFLQKNINEYKAAAADPLKKKALTKLTKYFKSPTTKKLLEYIKEIQEQIIQQKQKEQEQTLQNEQLQILREEERTTQEREKQKEQEQKLQEKQSREREQKLIEDQMLRRLREEEEQQRLREEEEQQRLREEEEQQRLREEHTQKRLREEHTQKRLREEEEQQRLREEHTQKRNKQKESVKINQQIIAENDCGGKITKYENSEKIEHWVTLTPINCCIGRIKNFTNIPTLKDRKNEYLKFFEKAIKEKYRVEINQNVLKDMKQYGFFVDTTVTNIGGKKRKTPNKNKNKHFGKTQKTHNRKNLSKITTKTKNIVRNHTKRIRYRRFL